MLNVELFTGDVFRIDVKKKIAFGSYNCLDVILQNNCQ